MQATIAAVAGLNPAKPRFIKRNTNPLCWIRLQSGKVEVVFKQVGLSPKGCANYAKH